MNIQSWLGSAKTAAGAISGITYAEDGATVELYKKQLEGLTLTQQKLAMSTAGLTAEQQKYVLSKIEGTAVTGKATIASLVELSAKQKKILTTLGVITGTETETGAEIILTKAKYDDIMASELLNEVEKKEILTSFGVADANTKQASSYGLLKGSMKSFTQVIKETWDATEGMGGSLKRVGGTMKGLWNELPKMGKIGIIAALIVAVNKLAGLFYDTTEEIHQRIEDAKNKISETESEISSLDNQINETTELINKMKEAGASEDAISTYEKENQLLKDQKKILEDIIKDEQTVIANESARLINNEGSSSRLDGMLGALQNFNIMGSSKQTPLVGGILGMADKSNGFERDGYIEDFEKGGFWNGMKNVGFDTDFFGLGAGIGPLISTFIPQKDPADDIVLQSKRLIEKYTALNEAYLKYLEMNPVRAAEFREHFNEDFAGITKNLGEYIPQLIDSRSKMAKENPNGIYNDEIKKIDDVLSSYYKSRPDIGFESIFKGEDEIASAIGDEIFTAYSKGGKSDDLAKIISSKISENSDMYKKLSEYGIIDLGDENWAKTTADKFIEYFALNDADTEEWANLNNVIKETKVSIDNLKNASGGIKSVASAFSELSEDGFVSIDTISSIKEAVGKNIDNWEDYENRLLNAKNGSADFNQVLSELTYKILENEFATIDLVNATDEEITAIENKIAATLRENGVENANVVAHEYVRMARINEAIAAYDGTQASYDSAAALISESLSAEQAKVAMNQLELAKINVNNAKITSSDDIDNIIAIANAALASEQTLKDLARAKAELDEGFVGPLSPATRKIMDGSYDFDFDKLDPSDFKVGAPRYSSPSSKKDTSADDAKKKAEEAEKARIEAYKEGLEARMDILGRYKAHIDTLDFGLDLLSEEDFEGQFDLLTLKLEQTTEYGKELKEEFERAASSIPKTAEETEALASHLNSLSGDIQNNIKNIREMTVALEKAKIGMIATKGQGYVDELSQELDSLEKRIDVLKSDNKEGYKYTNEILNMEMLLPNKSRINERVREKSKEDREIIKMEQETQDKLDDILRKQIEKNETLREEERAALLANMEELRDDTITKITEVETNFVTSLQNNEANATESCNNIADAINNTDVEFPEPNIDFTKAEKQFNDFGMVVDRLEDKASNLADSLDRIADTTGVTAPNPMPKSGNGSGANRNDGGVDFADPQDAKQGKDGNPRDIGESFDDKLKDYEKRIEEWIDQHSGSGYPFLQKYPITSRYGYRTHPVTGKRSFHSGIDFGAPLGTDIYSVSAGIVSNSGWIGGYGNCIIIKDANGNSWYYAHMHEPSPFKSGDKITKGQRIGIVGSTGMSTGAHLHLERRTASGGTSDPLPYLPYYASGTPKGNAYAKNLGLAGENYKSEILVDKQSGKMEFIDSPTLIDTSKTDVIGEKATAKIPKFADGTVHRDITSSTGITAADIDKLISKYCGSNSVFKPGMGAYFIEAQNASGIDALTLFSMAVHESGYGTSQIAKNKSNFFGYGAVDSNPYNMAYNYGSASNKENVRKGIIDIAKQIGKWYVNNRGQNTLYKIEHDPDGTGYRYASDTKWDSKIATHLEKFANYLGIDLGTSTTSQSGSAKEETENPLVSQFKKDIIEPFDEIADKAHNNFTKEVSAIDSLKYAGEMTDDTEIAKGYYDAAKKYSDEVLPSAIQAYRDTLNLYNAYLNDGGNDLEVIEAYEEALESLGDEIINAEEKTEQFRQSVIDLHDDGLSKIDDAISDYDFYNNWSESDKTKLELIDEKIRRDSQMFAEGYLTPDEYNQRKRGLDQERYDAVDEEMSKKISDINKRIEDGKLYNNWEGHDSELAAIKDEFAVYKEYFDNGHLSEERYNEIVDELKNNAYSAGKDSLMQAVEKIISDKEEDINDRKEALTLRQSKFNSYATLAQNHFNILNSIKEAHHSINKELRASKSMYEYLNEDTRKLLFNQEDFNVLSGKLNEIQNEAVKLQREYQNAIRTASKETLPEVTSHYQMQYETLMKSYEISKADLEIAKKRQQLDNVLKERNVRMFIDGEWQWVAKTQDVINAQNELADAEYSKEKAVDSLRQEGILNQFESEQNKIGTQMAFLDKDLSDWREKWTDIQEQIEGEQQDLHQILADMANSDVPELRNIVTSFGGIISDLIYDITGDRIGNAHRIENENHKYDGVTYNPDFDYSEAMKEYEVGTAEWNRLNQKRNAKILGEGLDYKMFASGTKYTPAGDILVGEEEPEAFIKANGHLIPINQPTLGNFGAGGIVFNQEQMSNLRSLWDLSNVNLKAYTHLINVPSSGNVDKHIDNSIHINGLTIDSNSGIINVDALKRYVGNH